MRSRLLRSYLFIFTLGLPRLIYAADQEQGDVRPRSPTKKRVTVPARRLHLDGPPAPVFPEVVNRDDEGRATMRAFRLEAPIAFDGKLDDEVYHRIPGVSGFLQSEPDEGAVATEQTEVWVLYDDEHIYLSGRCWDSHPERDGGQRDAAGQFRSLPEREFRRRPRHLSTTAETPFSSTPILSEVSSTASSRTSRTSTAIGTPFGTSRRVGSRAAGRWR